MGKLGITYPDDYKYLETLSDKIDEIVDWINKEEQKPKPTVCVYGCGQFKDLMKHYKEKHYNKA
jgi:hypothetical protein